MLPGGYFSQQGNVFSIDLIASANNVKIGNVLGGATYLYGIDRAIDLHLQIHAGVTIGAAAKSSSYSSPDAALSFVLPAGSRVYIQNKGRIWGGGGRGGNGDRGRRGNTNASSFVGGGGGGGAGTNSAGGLRAVSADPQANDGVNDATDGSAAAGGSTTGGAGGISEWGGGIGDEPYVRGADPQRGGDAIDFSGTPAIEIFIDNGSAGEIWAGANGGSGGYHINPLNDVVAPAKGDDTPGDMTSITINTTSARAVTYSLASTLTWIAGGNYPLVAGVVQRRPV